MKITGKKSFRKNGTSGISGYIISLSKSGIETSGFDVNTELDIIYKKMKLL